MEIKMIILLSVCFSHIGVVQAQSHSKKTDITEANALIKRILKEKATSFITELIPAENGKDVFEIESINDKIILRGSNALSVAGALNHYLKYIANCSITWNGINLNLPKTLPHPKNVIRKVTPYQYRYYLNYCTFNYTMSWWNWERWEKEIDWMALNGINMPLALTGQNAIWAKVYKELGFSEKELENFFSGPAYFSWFWMGNLDSWGGPLPKSWIEGEQALQKKILERERAFGMTPILPAFTGHVPPSFKDKFSNIQLKKTSWVGFPEVYILDPNEPMFTLIGKKFIEEQTKEYGTNHLYTADTFNENTPPVNDSIYLNNVSQKVYQAMSSADPQAIWVMQGWLFHHGAKFWGEKQTKALLNAVPNDKMIILDLWSERYPVWNRTEAYFGKPWIWCMLNNFGQNTAMNGTMERIASTPSATLYNPAAGKLSGIGLTMEGIEQNPVIYELMLENVWTDKAINVEKWLKGYTLRRYGKENHHAEKAWSILKKTVYSDTVTSSGLSNILTFRPSLLPKPKSSTTLRIPYNPEELLPAWKALIQAAPDLKNSDGFQYDLIDITRQVMANYSNILQQQLAKHYIERNGNAFKKNSIDFLNLIEDIDQLLATRKEFLLGNWLEQAKSKGLTPEEKSIYEKNARNLITLWGDKNSELHDYACKQWSGMLKGFYKPRWQQFFDLANEAIVNNKEMDLILFETTIKDWEWNWVNSNEKYTIETKGNPITMANYYFKKYYPIIEKAYQQKTINQ
ncbi:alpha-N-acetylglucosaminidase [Pseudopedobacter beijingensis]|uniref:Alpha-N-acetylglucosaminidase n=1 Tax=Pseudopedobacter beijingensis TaxID=1207056 RepID=A0ABW4IEM7_9SPHI